MTSARLFTIMNQNIVPCRYAKSCLVSRDVNMSVNKDMVYRLTNGLHGLCHYNYSNKKAQNKGLAFLVMTGNTTYISANERVRVLCRH